VNAVVRFFQAGAQGDAEIHRLQQGERTGTDYANHPALLGVSGLETLRELGRYSNARVYIGFDRHAAVNWAEKGECVSDQGNGKPARTQATLVQQWTELSPFPLPSKNDASQVVSLPPSTM